MVKYKLECGFDMPYRAVYWVVKYTDNEVKTIGVMYDGILAHQIVQFLNKQQEE